MMRTPRPFRTTILTCRCCTSSCTSSSRSPSVQHALFALHWRGAGVRPADRSVCPADRSVRSADHRGFTSSAPRLDVSHHMHHRIKPRSGPSTPKNSIVWQPGRRSSSVYYAEWERRSPFEVPMAAQNGVSNKGHLPLHSLPASSISPLDGGAGAATQEYAGSLSNEDTAFLDALLTDRKTGVSCERVLLSDFLQHFTLGSRTTAQLWIERGRVACRRTGILTKNRWLSAADAKQVLVDGRPLKRETVLYFQPSWGLTGGRIPGATIPDAVEESFPIGDEATFFRRHAKTQLGMFQRLKPVGIELLGRPGGSGLLVLTNCPKTACEMSSGATTSSSSSVPSLGGGGGGGGTKKNGVVDVEIHPSYTNTVGAAETRRLLESAYGCEILNHARGEPEPGDARSTIRFSSLQGARAWVARYGGLVSYRVVRLGEFSLKGMELGELRAVVHARAPADSQ